MIVQGLNHRLGTNCVTLQVTQFEGCNFLNISQAILVHLRHNRSSRNSSFRSTFINDISMKSNFWVCCRLHPNLSKMFGCTPEMDVLMMSKNSFLHLIDWDTLSFKVLLYGVWCFRDVDVSQRWTAASIFPGKNSLFFFARCAYSRLFQSTEQTPKDTYQMAIYDAHWRRPKVLVGYLFIFILKIV